MAPLAGLRPQGRHRRSALLVVTPSAVIALVSRSSSASERKVRACVLRRVTAGRVLDARYFGPGACVEYPPASSRGRSEGIALWQAVGPGSAPGATRQGSSYPLPVETNR